MLDFNGSLSSSSTDLSSNLIKKIVYFYTERKFDNLVTLFKDACSSLDADITKFYKEDINNLGLYVCQVVINKQLFLKVGLGNTKDSAYQNAIRQFVKLCFEKEKVKSQFTEDALESFYSELKESIDNIDLCDKLKVTLTRHCTDLIKMAHFSKINTINYEYLKKKLLDINSGMFLSECVRTLFDGVFLCSLFLNDRILLHQGTGKDHKEALENTVTEFFEAYEITSKPQLGNVIHLNGSSSKDEMLFQLGQLFKLKKLNAGKCPNYWDIIQECVKELHYSMVVECGVVRINGEIVVSLTNEENEYVSNLKAGIMFVELLSKEQRKKPSVSNQSEDLTDKSAMKFQKKPKICAEKERDEIMKEMVKAAYNDFKKDERQSFWNVLNREFIRKNYKVEPRYEDRRNEKKCTFVLNGWDIIEGIGIDKNTSRDAASRNLVDKYLPPPE